MRPVTKDEFYKVIGPMDVHPKVIESTLKHRILVSRWETKQREHVGTSFSDSWGIEPTTYRLEGRWSQAR